MLSLTEEHSIEQYREVISAFLGYASIFFWLIVFLPQLWENYVRKSSASLSIYFILLWIVGDLFNLAGSVLQGLIPTVILLALYYCASDIVLLGQVLYYRRYGIEEQDIYDQEASPTENDALITANRGHNTTNNRLASILSPMVIMGFGASLYLCASEPRHMVNLTAFGLKKGVPDEDSPLLFWPQVFGYISAVLYVTARLPQIYQNYQTKSCEGLSMAMFACSILGNTTYALSILVYSLEPTYVIANIPWLIGSAGTLFEDFFIFWQYYHYKEWAYEQMVN